jgi:hypothetical protein
MRHVKITATLGACAVALIAGFAFNNMGHGYTANGHAGISAAVAFDLACSQEAPGRLGIIGQLAPGHSPAELVAHGYQVFPAASGSVGRRATAGDRTVSLGWQTTTGAQSQVRDLANSSALSHVGVVRTRSLDPALQSCNYQLSDSPGALRLVKMATSAMLANGFLTQSQLNATSTISMVSDNPLNSAQVIVTIAVAGPKIDGGGPGVAPIYGLTPVVAFVDRRSGIVGQTGFGAWYN